MARARTVPPDDILTPHTPTIRALGRRLRTLIREILPSTTERGYAGWHAIGYRHPATGYVCGIFPYARHVRLLFEHGVLLQDPEQQLRGDWKQVRYLEFWTEDDIDLNVIRAFLLEAVALKQYYEPPIRRS